MKLLLAIFILIGTVNIELTTGDSTNGYLSIPNRQSALQRILGFGVVDPYPYFQK